MEGKTRERRYVREIKERMGCKSHNFSSHHYIFLKFKYVVCLTLFYNLIDWIWFIQCHFRDNVIANFLGKLVLGRCNRQLGLSCFTVGSSSFFSKSATRCPLFFLIVEIRFQLSWKIFYFLYQPLAVFKSKAHI